MSTPAIDAVDRYVTRDRLVGITAGTVSAPD